MTIRHRKEVHVVAWKAERSRLMSLRDFAIDLSRVDLHECVDIDAAHTENHGRCLHHAFAAERRFPAQAMNPFGISRSVDNNLWLDDGLTFLSLYKQCVNPVVLL